MSWIGSASEWKQGLGMRALQKVDELENQVDKLKKDRQQKQQQIDVLQQNLEKQKIKVEEETKQRKSLAKELESLGQACDSIQERTRTKGDSSLYMSNGAGELKRKIDDLESKNRQLESKLTFCTPSKNCSSNFTGASQNVDFYSHFGSSRRDASFSQKSPFKVAAVKKAIEPSAENPFCNPLNNFLNDSTLKTPKKNGPTTMLTNEGNEDNLYVRELEAKLAGCIKELEEFKSKCHESSSTSEKKYLDRNDDDSSMQCLKEEISVYKLKLEEAETKVEEAAGRMNTLQGELNCQRHNSEAAKQAFEKRTKNREHELLSETAMIKSDFVELEQKMKDMTKKMSQQDTLAMANQNAVQASLDKTLVKLASVEKEKAYQISSNNQLQAHLTTKEKNEEEQKKILSQLKQEKEMLFSQVESLKVKFSGAEESLTKNRSRLEFVEEQIQTQKYDLESLNQQKDCLTKEKDNLKKDLQDSVNYKIQVEEQMKEKLSKSEEKLNDVKIQLDSLLREKSNTGLKLEELEKNCALKLAGVHELEAEVCRLKEALEQTTSDKDASIEQLTNRLSNEEKLKEEDLSAIRKQCNNELEAANRTAIHILEDTQREKNEEISTLNEKVGDLEKKIGDLEMSESKIRQEKLNCELALWEYEGKLDMSTERQEKLVKDIEDCKLKLKCAEQMNDEKDTEIDLMTKNIEKVEDEFKNSQLKLSEVESAFDQNKNQLFEVTQLYDEQKVMYEDATIKKSSLENSMAVFREESDMALERSSKEAYDANFQCNQVQESLNSLTAQYRGQIDERRELERNFGSDREAWREEVAYLENDVKTLKEAAMIIGEENSNLHVSVAETQECIAVLEEQNQRQHGEISILKHDNGQLEGELERQQKDSKDYQDRIFTLNESVLKNVRLLSESEEKVIILGEMKETLTQNLAQKLTKLENLNRDINTLDCLRAQAVSRKLAQLEQSMCHLSSKEEELRVIRQEKETMFEKLSLSEERCINANAELTATTELLKTLEQQSSHDFNHVQEFLVAALQDSATRCSDVMTTIHSKQDSLVERLGSLQDAASKLDQQRRKEAVNETHRKEIALREDNIKQLETQIANYSSKCIKKDLSIEDLHQQVKREAKKNLELEAQHDTSKLDLQSALERLAQAQTAYNEEKEKACDRIHSLSQNLSSVKALLAEKDVVLKMFQDQVSGLQSTINEADLRLKGEANKNVLLQNDYHSYQEVMQLLNRNSQAESNKDTLEIADLKNKLCQTNSRLSFQSRKLLNLQAINDKLSCEVQQLNDHKSQAEETHRVLLQCKEDLELQCSEYELENNGDIVEAKTVAITRMEDLLQKFLTKYSCHIVEISRLPIGVLEACEENLICDKLDDLESMVDVILEREDIIQKKEIFEKKECMMKKISELQDNIICLEEMLENILSEKKTLQEKCEQLLAEKNNMAALNSEMQLTQANVTKNIELLEKQTDKHQGTIDYLTKQATSLEDALHTKQSAYHMEVSQLRTSDTELRKSLDDANRSRSEVETSLQKWQKNCSLAEEKLRLTQLERAELMDKVSKYLVEESSLQKKIGLLTADCEGRDQQLTRLQNDMSELQAKHDSNSSVVTDYNHIVSSSLKKLLPKLADLYASMIGVSNDSFEGLSLQNKTGECVISRIKALKEEHECWAPSSSTHEVDGSLFSGSVEYFKGLFGMWEDITDEIVEADHKQTRQCLHESRDLSEKNKLLSEDFAKLQETLAHLKAERESLQQKYNKQSNEKSTLEQFKSELDQKCAAEDLQVSSIIENYVVLKQESGSQAKLVDSLRESVLSLEEKLAISHAEYEHAQSQLKTGNSEKEQILKDHLVLCSDMESKLISYSKSLESLQKSRDLADDCLREAKLDKNEALHKLKELLEEETSLRSKLDILTMENDAKDLRRADDERLMAELNHNLHSSRTQHAKLKLEFDFIKEESSLMFNYLKALNEKSKELNKNKDQVEKEKEDLINEIEVLRAEYDSKVAQSSNTNEELQSQSESGKLNWQTEISALTDQLLKSMEETVSLTLKIQQLNIIIDELKKKLERIEEDKRVMENENNLLVSQDKERISQLDNDIKDYQTECNKLKEELITASLENATLSSRMNELNLTIEELSATVEKVNAEKTKVQQELDLLLSANNAKESEYNSIIEDLKKQSCQRDSRREELEEVIKETKTNLKSLEGKLALGCKTIHKLEKQLLKSQSHIDKLNAERILHHAKVKEGELNVKLVEEKLQEATKTIRDIEALSQEEILKVTAQQTEIEKLRVNIALLEKTNADCKDKIGTINLSNKNLKQELSKQRSRCGFLNKVDKEVETESETEIPDTPADNKENERRHILEESRSSIRRSTRLAQRKDSCASVKRPIMDSDTGKPKVIKLENSNLEGLPHKIVQGLNNIPAGNESPGIIRRPTTPMKLNRSENTLAEHKRPFRVIDSNSPVKFTEPKDQVKNVFAKKPVTNKIPSVRQRDDNCKTQ